MPDLAGLVVGLRRALVGEGSWDSVVERVTGAEGEAAEFSGDAGAGEESGSDGPAEPTQTTQAESRSAEASA